VVREDLATWRKLNVIPFLTSGIVGAKEGLLGEPYEDAAGNRYNPLVVQPVIVLSADRPPSKQSIAERWIVARDFRVVQRLPVMIRLYPEEDPDHRLRLGMSVEPTV
jgi:hypothetical protein